MKLLFFIVVSMAASLAFFYETDEEAIVNCESVCRKEYGEKSKLRKIKRGVFGNVTCECD